MSKPRNKPKHSFALLLLAAATPLLFGSQAQVTQTRQECIDSAWALYWNDRVGCDAQELNELNLCADEYNNAMAAADEIRDNALESSTIRATAEWGPATMNTLIDWLPRRLKRQPIFRIARMRATTSPFLHVISQSRRIPLGPSEINWPPTRQQVESCRKTRTSAMPIF